MTDEDDDRVETDDESQQDSAEKLLPGWGQPDPGSGWSTLNADKEPTVDSGARLKRRAADLGSEEATQRRRRRPLSLRSMAVESSGAALGDRVGSGPESSGDGGALGERLGGSSRRSTDERPVYEQSSPEQGPAADVYEPPRYEWPAPAEPAEAHEPPNYEWPAPAEPADTYEPPKYEWPAPAQAAADDEPPTASAGKPTYEPPMYTPPAGPEDPYAVAPGAGEDTAAQRLQALFSDQAQKVADRAEQARKLPSVAGDQAHKLTDVATGRAQKLSDVATGQAQKLSDVATGQAQKLSDVATGQAQKLSDLSDLAVERFNNLSTNLGARAQNLPVVGRGRSSDLSEAAGQHPEKAESQSRKLPAGIDQRSQELAKVFRERPEAGVLAAFLGGLTLATILKRLARR